MKNTSLIRIQFKSKLHVFNYLFDSSGNSFFSLVAINQRSLQTSWIYLVYKVFNKIFMCCKCVKKVDLSWIRTQHCCKPVKCSRFCSFNHIFYGNMLKKKVAFCDALRSAHIFIIFFLLCKRTKNDRWDKESKNENSQNHVKMLIKSLHQNTVIQWLGHTNHEFEI